MLLKGCGTAHSSVSIEGNGESYYAQYYVQDMVSYTEVREAKEASAISPIGGKVESGNEAEKAYQQIDDAEDAIKVD